MKLSTARAEIKRWGLLRFAYDCLMSSLKPWLTVCSIHLRPIRRHNRFPKLPPHRDVRVACTDELLAASNDPANDLGADWIRKALGRGEICVGAFEGDKLLAYTWRALGPTPHEKGLWVHFDEKYVYGFKAFTRPGYRQQHLQYAVSGHLDHWLLDHGYRDYIGFIETHNFPSLIAGEKRGHRKVGYAGYLILFGQVIPFRSPGAKRVGFGFFPPQVESAGSAPFVGQSLSGQSLGGKNSPAGKEIACPGQQVLSPPQGMRQSGKPSSTQASPGGGPQLRIHLRSLSFLPDFSGFFG